MNTASNLKPNILIVDDKRENLLALENVLKDEDANILKANSGNEALSKLLENECAVTLLDVQMPDMDGFETAALIRQHRKTRDVPIIFVTAINKEEKYVLRGYELGAIDYLFKPLNSAVVKAKVGAFLEIYKKRRDLDDKATELENLNASLCQVNSKLALSLRELRLLNEDLEQFASIASHDLKEPVRTIQAFLKLLQKRNDGKLDTESTDYLNFALNGASRMNQLIADLLEYTRTGTRPFDLQPIDCNKALRDAIHNLALLIEETKAEITMDNLPAVLGDGIQLAQLFQNLLNNAIKFRGERMPQIHVAVSKKEAQWEFAIKDNGVGIPEADQERIFALFQRLHPRSKVDGSGIGLAVCKRIIERHGGKIWVHSIPGEGSTFHFSIPSNSAAEQDKEKH